MSDPHPARASSEKEDKRTFLQKLAEFIHPGPDSRAELIETLAESPDHIIPGHDPLVMQSYKSVGPVGLEIVSLVEPV